MDAPGERRDFATYLARSVLEIATVGLACSSPAPTTSTQPLTSCWK
jgi:hypothetical protein